MEDDWVESQIEAVHGPHLITIPKDVLDQLLVEQKTEIERLRQQNAELVEALLECEQIAVRRQKINDEGGAWGGSMMAQKKARAAAAGTSKLLGEIRAHVRAAIAKATGGE